MKVLLILLVLINMDFLAEKELNINYLDFHKYTGEEVLVYGSKGCGKTYSIADKLLLQQCWQNEVDKIKILVVRKTFPALRATALDVLETRATTLHLPWNLNKSEWIARSGNLIFEFQSLNHKEDYTKLLSRTNIDFIWINELLDLTERDYEECTHRLRGGNSFYNQIICDFNPIDIYSWVYERFFEKNIGDVKRDRYNINHNHPEYLKTDKAKRYNNRLRRLKDHDYNLYKICFLGEWGSLEGVIFNWNIVPLPDHNFDEIWYGGDFGFTVDPAVLIKIYRKANEFWLQEMIYKTGLTNKYLAVGMKNNSNINHNDVSYWDSAEPKSIQELFDYGINVKPAIKGKDSVKAGIDYLQSLKIHIVEGSENLIKEQKTYVWAKDKNDKPTNKPIEFNDHAISAARYGIYTHMKAGSVVPHFGAV